MSHATAKCLLENILKTAKARAAPALKAAAAPGKGLEIALATETAATPTPTESFKSLKARLALGVNLASIKGLALAFLTQNFVGRIQFRESRCCPLVMLVGVGVQLLCELPERV